MSANDVITTAPRTGARSSAETQTQPQREARTRARTADTLAAGALTAFFLVLAAVSWRKWGTPEIDAGVDLTTARELAHGSVLYDDIRYFYGPLGIYALAGAFKVFGASLGVAFAFGLTVTAAIGATFYALARQALRPVVAGLATAVVLAIGFSGTQFNFVLPHTSSATLGLLFLLLELLALARRRPALAGLALGAACLTRVEFAAAAWIVAAAWLAGTWRVEGLRRTFRAALPLAVVGAVIPLAVYGLFASATGTERLLWENLWPRDFLRIAGFRAYREWTPFDLESVVSTLARGLVYVGLLLGATLTVARLRETRAARRAAAAPIDLKRPLRLVTQPAMAPAPLGLGTPLRLVTAKAGTPTTSLTASLVRALFPAVAAVLGLAVVAAAWKVTDVFPDARAAVQEEAKQLLLGMSVLPIVSLGVAAWVVARFLRRDRAAAPLTGAWPLDLALAAAAVILCSRAYDQFTMSSAAPYYAAPAVLVLALLHQRLIDRFPAAKPVVLAALAAIAVGIGLYNAFALYNDKGTTVHTAAGTYVAPTVSGGAEQQVIDFLRTHTKPGEPILALPSDGGTYFFTDRRLPLYDIAALPGLLDTKADEQAAITRVRAAGVHYAVVSERDTTAFETGHFGTGYNRLLGQYISSGTIAARIGPRGLAEGGGNPSRSFTIYELPR